MANLSRLLTLLLACTILIPLATPFTATGQVVTQTSTQYVTSTQVSTLFSTMQTNSTNTTPLRYLTRPFDYNYTTGSFSLNQMDTVPVQTSFEWQDYPCLYYDYFTFNATAGHEIRGHFSLTENGVGIQFIILSQSQLRNFGNCGNGNWDWELHTFASSYNFDWLVPETGVYAFMFFSRGFYGGAILITAQDYTVTIRP